MLLDLQDVRFEYSARFRLEIDRLQVNEREKIAVMGPNGSGKTTLLRLLAFLERPTSQGVFRYRGREVRRRKIDRDQIGFLRQHPWIFHGTVSDNLAYSLQTRGRSRAEIRRRVSQIAETLDLSSLLAARARQISGGEKKRVALGRVLIAEPDFLLLDEPMAHLDVSSQSIITDVLSELRTTVLFTVHDLGLAWELSDRTINLEMGRLSSETTGIAGGRRSRSASPTRGRGSWLSTAGTIRS